MTAGAKAFPGLQNRVGHARRYVYDVFYGHPRRDDAVLIVPELATNAVVHTRSGRGDLGMYRVVAYLGTEVVRVEVHDDGGVSTEPDVIPADEDHGYGLHLVEALADRWESEGDSVDGRCVWAEFSCSPDLDEPDVSLPATPSVLHDGPAG